MSVPDLKEIYRSIRDKVSDARDQVWKSLGLKVKIYRLKKVFRRFKQFHRENWDQTYKPALDYIFNEFLWITWANGLLLNVVFNYFLGFPLTVYSVTAWGALWYVLVHMTPSIRKEA